MGDHRLIPLLAAKVASNPRQLPITRGADHISAPRIEGLTARLGTVSGGLSIECHDSRNIASARELESWILTIVVPTK